MSLELKKGNFESFFELRKGFCCSKLLEQPAALLSTSSFFIIEEMGGGGGERTGGEGAGPSQSKTKKYFKLGVNKTKSLLDAIN